MNLIILTNMIFLSIVELEGADITAFSSFLDFVSNLSETIQSLWWLAVVIFTMIILIAALFSIRRKTISYTRIQIDRLIKNRKYIPGIFIELNESKEVMRYFIYRRKWKKRLIKSFNFIYDNAYGDILRKSCNDPKVCFHLNKTTTLGKIEKVVGAALDLHKRFRDGKEKLSADYSESQYLFEITYYPYVDALKVLEQYVKAANKRYVVLTGSAGNGKTNLLCSISELLINLKEAVLFLNSRDIEGDVLEFLFNELKLPAMYKKYTGLYLGLADFLLALRGKHFFIVIDAINENDSDGFGERITKFCNTIVKYKRIKVIVSCRNEYYQERFRESLVENVDMSAFEYDLKEQRYTSAAIDRIIKVYSKYFSYSGTISLSVQNLLSEQLLFLRIFFEVNQDSNVDALSIRKHEIFARYIETVKKNSKVDIENVLDTLTDFMLTNNNFDEISLSNLNRVGISFGTVKEIVDSSILISKKLVFHEGTIARTEQEVAYFVFDEMRDYCLAKRIVQNYTSGYSVDGDSILAKVKELKEAGVSCAEGIIHYTYILFKTNEAIIKAGKSEKLCNAILDIYRISERSEKRYYINNGHREEFQNLGLRIILTSGLAIADFEVLYIQDCLKKDPYEDGGKLFDTLLEGTIYDGINNLDLYLEILLGMKKKNEMREAFRVVFSHDLTDAYFVPEDLIRVHEELIDTAVSRAVQIQKVAELFLYCFEMKDTDIQEKLLDYFKNLSTHEEIYQQISSKIRRLCDAEVTGYE